MAFELIKKVRLCEVGLRDGLQNEKKILTADEKMELLDGVQAAGFPVIEVGSFVSPRAVPQMTDTDQLFKRMKKRDGVEYRALVANVKGVERAEACGCKKIKLNVSASVSHNLANLNCTPAQSVARFGECVERAGAAGIEVSGSISMAFGSPWDEEIPIGNVQEIVEAYLNAGITEISLSDASGMAYPSQVYDICLKMKENYPQVNWWLHFHNTRGLGIANILTAMQLGFTQFDTSFAGTGGCPFVPGAAGNVATEDVLHMCEEMGIETGIDLDCAMKVGHRAESLLGHPASSCVLKAGKAKDILLMKPEGQTIK